MDVPSAATPTPLPLILDPAVRDAAACDPLRDDMEIFNVGNSLYDQAMATAGSDDLSVRALGLETALFSGVPWDELGPSFNSPEIQDLLAERMSSPSARIRMTVGQYLWNQGTRVHRRHGAAAAGAALQWGRELLAAPPDDNRRRFDDAMRALDVAAELGSAAGQKAVVAEVCELVVNLLARAATVGDTIVPSLAFDVITRLRTHFTTEQRQQIRTGLEQLHEAAVADITPMSPPHLAGRLLDLRRDLAYADGDAEAAHQCDRKYAELLAEHAADRGEALIEATFLEDAITLAVRGEAPDAVVNGYRQRRRDALTRGIKSMKRTVTSVTLPPGVGEKLGAEHDRLSVLAVPDFIRAFAATSRPTIGLVRESIRRSAKTAPLSQLFPLQTIASPGETVATGNDDDDLLMVHGVRLLQIGAGLNLLPIWQARQARGDLTTEALVDALSASGNFHEDALETIAEGLEDALAGRGVSALHVLIPQLEDVLRRLLQMSGHDPGRINPSDPAVTEEISLGSILAGLASDAVISEDDAFLFRLVLEEPRGLHLRDRTAHGLMRKASCTPQALVCVLQCYAVVAGLPTVTARGPLGAR
jgi:hypothetical protein